MAGDCISLIQSADTPEQPGISPDPLTTNVSLPTGDVSAGMRATNLAPDADRLRLLAELVPAMGHDIRNMLAVVVSSTELARRQCQPVAAELFEAIGMAARNAAELTGTLMQLSGCNARPASPDALVDVNRRLQALLPIFDRILPLDTTLHIQLVNTSRWLVRVGVAEFDSAILNLVSNARDALTAADIRGGQVMIRSRNIRLRGPDGSLLEHVLISVADTGPGMDKTTLARVWEPFFTTKGPDGTGLGLLQVRRFAEGAGRKARIRSAPGRGTLVLLWLPCHRAEPGPHPPVNQDAMPAAGPAAGTPAFD
jgi:signal transduction histidine kinase